MRITSGVYRGRTIAAPEGLDVRPTSDKVRQAVFNILFSMGYPEGAHVIDGFCGTGALGLEALSRGAAFCVFMDNAASSLQRCKANIASLKAGERSKVLRLDVTKADKVSAGLEPASLFFLDPPYGKGLIEPALRALSAGGWLEAGALGVLESEKAAPDALPEGFETESSRFYAGTRLDLVRYRPNP